MGGLGKTSNKFLLIEKFHMFLIYHGKKLTTIGMFTRKKNTHAKIIEWKNIHNCFSIQIVKGLHYTDKIYTDYSR